MNNNGRQGKTTKKEETSRKGARRGKMCAAEMWEKAEGEGGGFNGGGRSHHRCGKGGG